MDKFNDEQAKELMELLIKTPIMKHKNEPCGLSFDKLMKDLKSQRGEIK